MRRYLWYSEVIIVCDRLAIWGMIGRWIKPRVIDSSEDFFRHLFPVAVQMVRTVFDLLKRYNMQWNGTSLRVQVVGSDLGSFFSSGKGKEMARRTRNLVIFNNSFTNVVELNLAPLKTLIIVEVFVETLQMKSREFAWVFSPLILPDFVSDLQNQSS